MAIKKIKYHYEELIKLRKMIEPLEEYTSAIYFLKQNDKVVYIGASHNVIARIMSHLSSRLKRFDNFHIVLCSEDKLSFEEKKHIQEQNPIYNRFLNKNAAPYGNSTGKAKEKVFRIRISEKDRAELDEVAKQEGVTASEFARESIANRVKRLLKTKK